MFGSLVPSLPSHIRPATILAGDDVVHVSAIHIAAVHCPIRSSKGCIEPQPCKAQHLHFNIL